MTVVTQSTTAQQKAEAEKFLRTVQATYPHLLILGYQAILNATVRGMQELEIYNDSLSEAKFMAGLRHAMNTGIVPKPPAQIQTVEVERQLTPEEQEAQRAQQEQARQALADQRRTERKVQEDLHSRQSGYRNHADKSPEARGPLAEVASALATTQDAAAQRVLVRELANYKIYFGGREARQMSERIQKDLGQIIERDPDNSINAHRTMQARDKAFAKIEREKNQRQSAYFEA